ncbi:MAG: glutathione S-transferase family protein [Hyphomicrobiales bacterium]
MSVPVLYDFALDAGCYAVRLGASLMGREITIRDVDVVPGSEHQSPEFLAINPKGSVPVLVDGEETIIQPSGILIHLAKGTPWAAEDGDKFGALIFASDALLTFNIGRHAALFDQPGTGHYEHIEPVTRQVKAKLRTLEDEMSLATLRGQRFLTGDAPTIADIIAFPVFAQSRDLRIEPEAYPALRLWARRVRKLPGFIGMPGVPDYH